MVDDITIFVVVDSGMSPLRRRIDGLVRGSNATIVGFGLKVLPTRAQIAKTKPRVCIIEAAGAEATSVAFARDVQRESPRTRIVIMGEDPDPATMARAVMAGAWNYLPLDVNYPVFVGAMADAAAGRRPHAKSPFAQAACLLPARPQRLKPGQPRLGRADRINITRCLKLRIADQEIADYLGLDREQVVRYIADQACGRRSVFDSSGHDLAIIAGVLAFVAASWVISHVWHEALEARPFMYVPVSGRLLYEDGAPIPADTVTLTFLSIAPHTNPKMRPRPGLTLVDPQSGRFGWVTSRHHGDGIVTGHHKVLVTGKDRMPLPTSIVPAEYVDIGTTPLEVNSSARTYELRVRRPPVTHAEPPSIDDSPGQ